MKIAAITMVYNEASLLPYFLRHYEYLDEIYVLYETDSTDDTLKILKQASNVIIKNCHAEGGLDDIDKVNLINNTLHTIKADWVYVVDCDEFIFSPQESPNDFLIRQSCENYNVVRAGMFQIYRHRTDKDLDPSLPPIPQRVHGDPDLFSTTEGPHKARNAVYVKPIVVKPSSEIRFQPGNHVVEGDIRVSPELYMGTHWQMADPSIAIDRRIKNKARMSERNKKLGMGWQHWDVTEEWLRAECDRHLDDPLIDELYLYSNKNFKNYDSLMRSKTNMNNLNPWNHLICFVVPNRITPISAWHEHIPFAMFLVELLRPKMIVELGTHYGDSYCAFCQAVKELHLDTACYAVDTWKGDPQSGLYGPEVLADLRAHHDPLYSSFSRLIQSTFDEASEHFADGTVDLLHIDGYHTYESVRHDFEAWLPKMSSHGVLLFHDTNVREQDFGIRKFWDEVKSKYPHFEFRHGHGLGVLAVGKVRSKELQKLFELPEEESIRIRDFFFQLGHQLTTRVRNKAMAFELENQKGQLQELNADLESKGARIANLEASLQEKVAQIHSLESEIDSLESQMQQIQRSIPMQLVNRYQRVVERLLRRGTRRRNYYELGIAGIRVILNEGWRSFWKECRQWLRERISSISIRRSIARQYKIKKVEPSQRKKASTRTQIHANRRFPLHIQNPQNTIVLISHDANIGGASLLALRIAHVMVTVFRRELVIILGSSGPLETQFKKYGDVFCLHLRRFDCLDNPNHVNELINTLRSNGLRYCLCNTAVIGSLIPILKRNGFYVVSLVHELPTTIKLLGATKSARNIARYADRVIFAAEFVRRQFTEEYSTKESKVIIKPQGAYLQSELLDNPEQARLNLRKRLRIDKDAFIFLGCGYADLRKGYDLFIQVARRVISQLPSTDVHFLWVGPIDNRIETWVKHDIEKMGISNRMHYLNYVAELQAIYCASDVFILPSREDPFPSVVLEAMAAGIPMIAFQDAGGAPEALADGCGVIVPYLDVQAMADAAIELLLNKDRREYITEKAQTSIEEKHDFKKYVGFLLDLFGTSESPAGTVPSQNALELKCVSVIIPNYNCEKYLAERLQSVIGQTYQPAEIIFLDDASTDKGVEVARRILQGSGIKYRIIENKNNEGAFNQWVKGFQLAEGELVWIAEADDVCEPDFLEEVVPKFDDEVTLVYTQSQVIDAHSRKIDYSYTSYTADLSPDKWNADYCQSGALEVNDGLAIKNTIPNASAVVIRKSAFAGIEDELRQFKVCGDWFTYVYVLRTGKVSFCHNVLNYHRRHSQSVINRSEKTELFYKEILSVQEFVLKNYIVRSAVWEQMKIHTTAEYKRLGCQGQESRDIMRNPDLASRMQDLDRLGQQLTLKQEQRHRIMIIIPDLEFGGGQMFGIMLANFLSATNDVVLYNARPYLINDEIMETISAGVRLSEGSGSPDEAAQIIDTYRIDAVISNVWWADKLAYYAVKDKNVKWVLVMHGCYEALVANPHWDGDFQKIVRQLLLKADHIVYTADKNLKAIESLGLSLKDKLVKINNGFFKPAGFTAKSRADFGVNDSDFVFGLISRAIPEKGWEQAILATVKLNKILENRRAHLFLIGESKYADDLKAKYGKGETIHFVGFQSNLAEWIAMFDAGLLPSYFQSESQPLIIIEFIAHNKPVIATDIGEIRTMLVRDGKQAGILIPTVASTIQVDHLFSAMKRLAFNEDHIYDTLRANCEKLFQPYDMKTCAEAYMSLIEKQG